MLTSSRARLRTLQWKQTSSMWVTIQSGTMQAVAINCRCHTQLMYCEAAYGGQMSDACLAQLPSPLTTSLMGVGVADFWYPVSGMIV